MTEPKAWHCPACNAYHAPHVDTCPKPKPPINLGGQHSYAAMNPDYIQRVIRGQSKTVAL